MRSIFATVLCLSLGAALLVGCGGGGGSTVDTTPTVPTNPPTSGTLSSVTVLGGNNQTASVNSELAQALHVQLLDAQGRAVVGQTVAFRVVAGGGAMFAGAGTSDANGQVRDRWTLGPQAGEQRVEVRVVDASGAAVVLANFVANATSGAPAVFAELSGGGQSGYQLQPLPQPVKFVVKDSQGNPRPGTVVWLLVDNGGTVEPPVATTDAQGEVSAVWTLGLPFGYHTLNARVDGLPAIDLRANVLRAPSSGQPGAVQVATGNNQTMAQHEQLRLSAYVLDARGLRVPDVEVVFSAAPGSGYITPARVRTNSEGEAVWTGYVHNAGAQQVQAAVEGVPPVAFQVNVSASAFRFDGEYACTVPPRTAMPGVLRITGGVMGFFGSGSYGTIDQTTGAITITNGSKFGDIAARFIGTLAVGEEERVTISGSGFSYQRSFGPNATIVITEVNEGPWSCVRL